MAYRIRPCTLIVTPKDNDPIYAEGATFIEIEDEAAGCFLKLRQDENIIRLDFEEWEYLTEAMKMLASNWNENA